MSWGGDNTENITFHIAYRFQTRCSESENLKIKGEYLELLILSAWGSLQETLQHGWARTLRRMWGFCKQTNDSLKRLNVCYLLWETHWGGRRGCWTALHPAAVLFKPVRPGGACRCVHLLVVMNVLFTCCFTQQEVELCWLHAEHLNASLRLMLSITADQCSTYWFACNWSVGINTLCVNVCVCDLSHLV